jgi:hypothetical protein
MPSGEKARRGRHTTGDNFLEGARNAWLRLFEEWWPQIGLSLAATRNQRNATMLHVRKGMSQLSEKSGSGLLTQFCTSEVDVANGTGVRHIKVRVANLHKKILRLRPIVGDAESKTFGWISRLSELNRGPIEAVLPGAISVFARTISLQKQMFTIEQEFRLEQAKLDSRAAYFCQTQLLDYLHSRRYALEPLTLANALAGLPDMGWRQSHKRCSAIPHSGLTNMSYLTFQLLERFCTFCAESGSPVSAEVFRKRLKLRSSKHEEARQFLARNWYDLAIAIEKCQLSAIPLGELKFAITAAFLGRVAEPKDVIEQTLADSKRLDLSLL